jgi:hypothetical protein
LTPLATAVALEAVRNRKAAVVLDRDREAAVHVVDPVRAANRRNPKVVPVRDLRKKVVPNLVRVLEADQRRPVRRSRTNRIAKNVAVLKAEKNLILVRLHPTTNVEQVPEAQALTIKDVKATSTIKKLKRQRIFDSFCNSFLFFFIRSKIIFVFFSHGAQVFK